MDSDSDSCSAQLAIRAVSPEQSPQPFPPALDPPTGPAPPSKAKDTHTLPRLVRLQSLTGLNMLSRSTRSAAVPPQQSPSAAAFSKRLSRQAQAQARPVDEVRSPRVAGWKKAASVFKRIIQRRERQRSPRKPHKRLSTEVHRKPSLLERSGVVAKLSLNRSTLGWSTVRHASTGTDWADELEATEFGELDISAVQPAVASSAATLPVTTPPRDQQRQQVQHTHCTPRQQAHSVIQHQFTVCSPRSTPRRTRPALPSPRSAKKVTNRGRPVKRREGGRQNWTTPDNPAAPRGKFTVVGSEKRQKSDRRELSVGSSSDWESIASSSAASDDEDGEDEPEEGVVGSETAVAQAQAAQPVPSPAEVDSDEERAILDPETTGENSPSLRVGQPAIDRPRSSQGVLGAIDPRLVAAVAPLNLTEKSVTPKSPFLPRTNLTPRPTIGPPPRRLLEHTPPSPATSGSPTPTKACVATATAHPSPLASKFEPNSASGPRDPTKFIYADTPDKELEEDAVELVIGPRLSLRRAPFTWSGPSSSAPAGGDSSTVSSDSESADGAHSVRASINKAQVGRRTIATRASIELLRGQTSRGSLRSAPPDAPQLSPWQQPVEPLRIVPRSPRVTRAASSPVVVRDGNQSPRSTTPGRRPLPPTPRGDTRPLSIPAAATQPARATARTPNPWTNGPRTPARATATATGTSAARRVTAVMPSDSEEDGSEVWRTPPTSPTGEMERLPRTVELFARGVERKPSLSGRSSPRSLRI